MKQSSLLNSLAILLSLSFFALPALAQKANRFNAPDPSKLELASVNALIMDVKTGEILYSKNTNKVTPIASVTKLMGAMVVLDSKPKMDEILDVQIHETKELKGVYSRVRVGSKLTRKEMLRLSLMSSENRIAASLAYHYPGGTPAFIKAMNQKARALGMKNTRFVEPTGLSAQNVSSAADLAKMVLASSKYQTIRELSTSEQKNSHFQKPSHTLHFVNTNPLVRAGKWDVKVSKTGFINAAGHCLVMMANVQGRDLAMVFLDSFGKRSHVGDAGRVREWLETGRIRNKVPATAKAYERRKQELLSSSS